MTRDILLKRVYEPAAKSDGVRVLVDRLWPRGLKREDAALDDWAKEVTPSADLRKWFHQDPSRWAAFRRRYEKELRENADDVHAFLKKVGKKRLTLLYATKDEDHNHAIVLARHLRRMK